MATKYVELSDALDDLRSVVEDLYGVANILERTRDRKLAALAPLAVELAKRANELHATISLTRAGR